MRKFRQSLGYAVDGIKYGLKTQRNFKIQLTIGSIALLTSFVFKIQPWEVIAISISMALVLFAELINTSMETTLDLITSEHNEQVMIAKDVAAAAVLITSINSVIVGTIIFLPRVLKLIF